MGGDAVADDDLIEDDAEPTAWWIIGLGFALSIGIGLTAGGDRAIWVIAALPASHSGDSWKKACTMPS